MARAKAAIKKSGASDEYVDALAHPRTHPEDVEARIQAQIESALRKGAKTQKDHHPGSSHAHSVARSNNTPTSSTPRRDKENEERKTSAAASFQAAFQAAAFAWDESVALHAAEAAAKLEAAEAKELAKLRAKGVLGPEFETPADLPAHLRMREPASTAEDVDVAARRRARLRRQRRRRVAEAPGAVQVRPGTPTDESSSHRGQSRAHAARAPQAKIVVLKLEGHRMVVHVGGANRSVLVSPGGESRRRIAAPRDLVREIEEGRFAGPLVRKPPVQNPAPGLAGSSRKWLDPTRGEKPAGGAPFAGTPPPAVRPTSGLSVTSDMRFVPPPEEPATDRPVKGSSKQPRKTPKQFFDRLFGIQDKLAKKHAAESGGGQQRPRGDGDAPEVAQRLEFAGALPASPRSGERSVSPAKHYPEGPRPFLKLGLAREGAPKHDGDAAKALGGTAALRAHRARTSSSAEYEYRRAVAAERAVSVGGGFASGSGRGHSCPRRPGGGKARRQETGEEPVQTRARGRPPPRRPAAAVADWFGAGRGEPKAAASPPPKSQAQVETDISQMWFGAPPPQVSKRPKEDAGKGKAPTNPFEFGGGSSSGAGGAKAEEASDDWDLPPTKKKNPFG